MVEWKEVLTDEAMKEEEIITQLIKTFKNTYRNSTLEFIKNVEDPFLRHKLEAQLNKLWH